MAWHTKRLRRHATVRRQTPRAVFRVASFMASRHSSRTTSTSRASRRCGGPTRGRPGCRRRRASSPGCTWPPGLTSLGKTQMSEFGFSASAEHPRLGPVRNPWNTDYTAGASSSGSGAFVAAGVVPIAHANDGGGSIRIPACVQRACRAEAVARPVAAGPGAAADAGGHRHQRCADSVRARHRGVLPGGRAHVAQPQAGAASATSPARAGSGCGSPCAPARYSASAAPRCGS